MPQAAERRRKIRSAVILAVLLVGLGIAWLSYLSTSHSECGSALVAALSQAACQGDAVRWYLAWVLIAGGAIAVSAHLIIRDEVFRRLRRRLIGNLRHRRQAGMLRHR